eukprot:scaffold1593_cov170-Ochromonas_danica.AAC.3
MDISTHSNSSTTQSVGPPETTKQPADPFAATSSNGRERVSSSSNGRERVSSLPPTAPPPAPAPAVPDFPPRLSHSNSLPGVAPPPPPVHVDPFDPFSSEPLAPPVPAAPHDFMVADPFADHSVGIGEDEFNDSHAWDSTAFSDGWPSPIQPDKTPDSTNLVTKSSLPVKRLDTIFENPSSPAESPLPSSSKPAVSVRPRQKQSSEHSFGTNTGQTSSVPAAFPMPTTNLSQESFNPNTSIPHDLQQQLDLAKSVVVVQEEKINQAAAYIQYQDQQIAALQQQLEAAQTASNKSTEGATLSLELQEKMKIQDAKIHAAEQEAAIFKAQIEEMQQRLQQAKDYIDYQTEQIAQLSAGQGGGSTGSDDIEEMKTKLQQAADYINYQAEQLTEAEHIIDSLKKGISNTNSSKKDQEESSQLAIIQRELEAMKAQRDRMEEFMNHQEEEQQKALDEKDKVVVDLKKQIEQLQADLLSAQQAVISTKSTATASGASAKAELDIMKAKLQEAADHIDYQNEQIAALEDANNANSEEIVKLRASLAELQGLKEKADNADTIKAQFTQQEIEYKNALQQKDQEMQSKMAQAIQAVKDEFEQKLASKTAELNASQVRVEDAEKKVKVAESALQQSKQSIATLTQQLATFDEIKKQLETKLQDAQAKLQQAADYINHQHEQIEQLEIQQGQVNENEESLGKELQHLQEVNAQLQTEKDDLTKQCSDKEAELDQLHSQLTAMEEELTQLHSSLATQQNEASSLHDKLAIIADLEKTVAEREYTINELHIEMEEEHKSHEQALSKLEEEWRNKFSALSLKHDKLGKDHEDLLDTTKLKVEQGQKYIDSLKTSLDGKDKDIIKLNKDLATALGESKLLQEKIDQMLADASLQKSSGADSMATLQKKLVDAADEISHLDEQLTAVADENVVLKTKLDAMEKKVQLADELQKDVDEMQGKIDELIEENNSLRSQKTSQSPPSLPVSTKQTQELDAANKKVTTLEQQVKQLQTQLQEKHNDHQQSDPHVDYDAFLSMSKQVEKAREYVTYVNQQLAEKDKLIASLQARVSASPIKASPEVDYDEYASMRTKVGQAKAYIDYLNGQLKEKESSIVELQQQLDEAQEHLTQLQLAPPVPSTPSKSNKDDLHLVQEKLIKTLEKEAEQQKGEIQRLQTQTTDQAAAMTKLQEQIDLLQKQQTSSTTDVEARVREVQSKLARLVEAAAYHLLELDLAKEQTIEISSFDLTKAQEIGQLFDIVYENLAVSIHSLQQEKLTLASRLEDTEKTKQQTKEENDKLVAELISTKVELAGALNDYDVMKMKLKEFQRQPLPAGADAGYSMGPPNMASSSSHSASSAQRPRQSLSTPNGSRR